MVISGFYLKNAGGRGGGGEKAAKTSILLTPMYTVTIFVTATQLRSYTGAKGGHGPLSFCLGPGHAFLVFGEHIDVY